MCLALPCEKPLQCEENITKFPGCITGKKCAIYNVVHACMYAHTHLLTVQLAKHTRQANHHILVEIQFKSKKTEPT